MTWQDAIFTAGGIVFAIALLPSLLGKDKPSWLTSFSTAVFLGAYAYAYIDLELFWAAGVNLLEAVMWLWLGCQVFVRNLRSAEAK